MWLQETPSGKIARAPNLERFRAELEGARGDATEAPGALGEVVVSVAWGVAAALAVYVTLALQPNLSWGIYAGF